MTLPSTAWQPDVQDISMIDRVACAISGLDPKDLGSHPRWRRKARAAVEAMREPTEPTEAMKAGEETHWGYKCHSCGGLTEGWYDYIDRALSS